MSFERMGGPIAALLADPAVSEILVNGPENVYADVAGRLDRVDVRFRDSTELRSTISRLVGACGRRIDDATPLVDARLPDGSRVNAVLPPIAVDGPLLTIRRFGARPLRMEDIVRLGTATAEQAETIAEIVRRRLNVIVSGGTSSGKTTTLGALAAFFDAGERIVTVEDAAELVVQSPHVVRLETRPSSVEGRGAVTIRDLVRNALRMRPDRIIVGEVRGGEAIDLVMAMNTGHDGSLSTIHANGPTDAMRRLETMALLGGVDLPHAAVREQVAAAVHAVVHQERQRDGRRIIAAVVGVGLRDGIWATCPPLDRIGGGA